MNFNIPFLKRRAAPPARYVPDGWRIYAIGDVHGCLDQLNRMLDAIAKDLDGWEGRGHLIFLGDLIDRGPDSAGVIERLVSGELPGERATFLMGNHEEVMLECVDGSVERFRSWIQFGGLETLESYGLSRAEILEQASSLPHVIRDIVPAGHVEFIRSFEDHIGIGDYLFVHAGIRPGVPLEDQSPRDLRWIRSGFLDNLVDHGPLVVHGHTIVPSVEVHRNRIAVDTGCYSSGTLTALVLDGSKKGRISIGPRPANMSSPSSGNKI